MSDAGPDPFTRMMTLEPHGPDTYVGTGPRYPWGGLYGGQIVAQALHAAAQTVVPEHRVHSLHAYFIRRGDHAEPVRYEVARTRNGRSFTTRTVEARQAVGAILSLSASFQGDEEAPEVQTTTLPEVPGPDSAPSDSWSPAYDRVTLPPDAAHVLDPRGRDAPPDSGLIGFSLDHAVWFHRPLRADEWHLHTVTCHGLISSRGLTVGRVFAADGTHVATVTQEVLLRPRR
jgi:acyl-CoA thioesterase-2